MSSPVGFWSYARSDDAHSDGQLSQLRTLVGKAIALQYGADINIWQDIQAIPPGADWAASIERTINQTVFFIPIVTPRYLKSTHCFAEFHSFRSRMVDLSHDARRRRWHRFWLGHRFMAEQFRYLQVLQPFLAVPGPFQEPLFVHSDSSGGAHRLRSAELWILQRVLSAVGLPTSYQHYEFASADRRMLACGLLASIDDQLVFHKRSYKSAKRLREMLEKIATWLFVLAGLFTLAHVIDIMLVHVDSPEAVEAFVAIFCTASPAFAAALHGVMTKLETGRVAVQAAQVRTRLFVLRTAVSTAMESVALVDWFSMARLRDDAMEVAMLLSRENERWRDLIRYQETEIPA